MRFGIALAVALVLTAPCAAQALPELRLTPHGVSEGTPTAEVDVIVTTPPDKPARFRVHTIDGTAKAGEDYVAIQGRRIETTTFTTIRIVIIDDNVAEPTESFFVEITDVENAAPERTRVEVVITDPGMLPAPEFGQTRAVEGNRYEIQQVNVFITAQHVVDVAYSLRVFTTPITARNHLDFAPIDTRITFRPGQKTVTLPVTIYGDNDDEEDETFRLSLDGTASTAIFVIEDDDDPNALPTLTIDDAQVFERTGQPSLARFRLSLSAPGVNGVSVRYDTVDDGAENGVDYFGGPGVIRFEPGQVLQWLELEVAGDDEQEDHEFFEVHIRDVNGANLDRPWANGAIRDDDAPGARLLWLHDAIAVERTNGLSYAVFRLELSRPSSEPIDVRWSAADLDIFFPTPARATAGRDYAGTLSAVRFEPGEVIKQIAIPIWGDAVPENDEYFGLYAAPGGAGLTDWPQPAVGVIVDDDRDWPLPRLGISDSEVLERDASSTVQLTLTLDKPAAAPASVVVNTRPVTADANDFDAANVTVTFAPGETTKTFELRLRGDDIEEPAELFEVRLSDGAGLSIVRDAAVITITDDDAPVTRRRAARH